MDEESKGQGGVPARKEDFFGRWKIADQRDAGVAVHIGERAIRSELAWIRLSVDEWRIDERGHLCLDGEHAGLLVHVTVVLDGSGGAELTWNDGVTFAAEVRLVR